MLVNELFYNVNLCSPRRHFVTAFNPGEIGESIQRINSTRSIDGIRVTSFNNTVATAEILEVCSFLSDLFSSLNSQFINRFREVSDLIL